jgi:hypothetical protein
MLNDTNKKKIFKKAMEKNMCQSKLICKSRDHGNREIP